jgi:hypothetical protein
MYSPTHLAYPLFTALYMNIMPKDIRNNMGVMDIVNYDPW